jgi:hypothetical protein
MSIKFKIGFTMDAETLFGLMSKFLPVENLSVEELIERRPVEAIAHAVKRITAKRITTKHKKRPVQLDSGINGIIMTAISDKPARPIDIRPKVIAAGFSANSLTSRMMFLRERGIIEPVGDGTWRKK